jgi:predicted O-methyltransferase YrrM
MADGRPRDAVEHIRDMTTPGVDPGDRRALYHIVGRFECGCILEIGTNVGGSTMAIAAAMSRQLGGLLTTLDILDVNAPDGQWAKAGLKRSPPPRQHRSRGNV